ncbi:MAG: hypothetical protein DDT31_01595 [Syntrophomonadaceae bacterium]|nr:hypothetical protein [Bacillota bacterium]
MTQTLTEAEWEAEFEFRISAMEETMKHLDTHGLFGAQPERAKLIVNVEVLPPDRINTEEQGDLIHQRL